MIWTERHSYHMRTGPYTAEVWYNERLDTWCWEVARGDDIVDRRAPAPPCATTRTTAKQEAERAIEADRERRKALRDKALRGRSKPANV